MICCNKIKMLVYDCTREVICSKMRWKTLKQTQEKLQAAYVWLFKAILDLGEFGTPHHNILYE